MKEVVNTFVSQTDILVEINIANNVIKTTPSHPFWVIGKGWTNALDLKLDDVLVDSLGNNININSIRIKKLREPVKVYNFEVNDWHTYFVGKQNIYVHNTCTNTPFVPESYWTQNAPKLAAPGITYTHQKLNTKTGEIEHSFVVYDYAGRQMYRIDYTDHGRIDHGDPHLHVTTWGPGDDPKNGSGKRYDK